MMLVGVLPPTAGVRVFKASPGRHPARVPHRSQLGAGSALLTLLRGALVDVLLKPRKLEPV